ncbi:heme exporter protein CcmB [Parvibaculum sp.]|jgi:heme exporter protein B|uniref:heme exporter protein CcmB n=1 Tax=Parvibaculum sp. TaxID=2024848 RepID=UPI001B0F9365|nr:heme exporter protein CcmB [Parvibaculum sp.]MBO6677293.1 heme exporter protein CcmB [Parvibaculum sp.]MBO6684949.1 heme exporter protein CcmB [Parvibaculum sp.]MBO6904714.1 heme exporter protein CcmB [Parvibaculum sp.]
MSRAFLALLLRDLRLAARLGGGGGMAVFFFLVVIAIVPLGVGPDRPLLASLAPGMLWVALLLAALLTLDRLFQADYEDGSLDLLSTGPLPLELVAVAKALAHWIVTGLPLVVSAPLLGVLLNLPSAAALPLTLAMLIGTPALSFLGSVGAALTVGIRRGGLLASLLVLPFYIPVLIFGVGAAAAASGGFEGEAGRQAFLLLGAVTLASFAVGPLAAAAALRANLR